MPNRPLKADDEIIRQQLSIAGLKPGMTALEAAGGTAVGGMGITGQVSSIMSDIIGSKGRVYLVDSSAARLKQCKELMKSIRNILYVVADLTELKMDSNIIDFSFSRLVFNSLSNPVAALEEMIRVTKPGGRIAVSDLDFNGMSHYPVAPHLESQLQELFQELQRIKIFDPFVGRKLYSLFHEAGLKEIKVHLLPHHLVAGEPNAKDMEDWTFRLKMVKELLKKESIQLKFNLENFKTDLFAYFENPSRFSYSPLILVEGRK